MNPKPLHILGKHYIIKLYIPSISVIHSLGWCCGQTWGFHTVLDFQPLLTCGFLFVCFILRQCLTKLPVRTYTCDPPFSAFWSAGIIGMCHSPHSGESSHFTDEETEPRKVKRLSNVCSVCWSGVGQVQIWEGDGGGVGRELEHPDINILSRVLTPSFTDRNSHWYTRNPLLPHLPVHPRLTPTTPVTCSWV